MMPRTDALHYCLVLCRFMQFDASSYETSPEIYALEEKVKSHLPQSEQLNIKCMECTNIFAFKIDDGNRIIYLTRSYNSQKLS